MRARLAFIPAVVTAALLASGPAAAGSVVVSPVTVPEWKAVYGRVEARDMVPARARIGGTLVSLDVAEGDTVTAGQRIGTVRDDKIEFQINALDARLRALSAQLDNALAELGRGQQLVERGVATAQRLDQLRTQADVLRNQIAAAEAEKQVIVQQGAEGAVIAPSDGMVLTVPVTDGAVVMPGEVIATIGGGGFFLRLAIPERHAALLKEGAPLEIEAGAKAAEGRLAKVYPQIETGRVIADVEVDDLPTAFVDARVLVRVPVGERETIVVPRAAVASRSGLDFVRVRTAAGEADRTVVLGRAMADGVEVLTGLNPGDEVILP
ncbi:efflux RND transporter periplasmic adaptor subunit [Chthonobacter rhizosphaerae]|uniref:efflux RND transporter periplasmic adaptor subunit n=1 Tax=Chthonobacter rhizosphaerae TaxID=2735553 RepID=UPI0015EED2F1|nr:efflux RND transporter periplasmic adaptor subunit [Chthonobacter rhizosphaerae]